MQIVPKHKYSVVLLKRDCYSSAEVAQCGQPHYGGQYGQYGLLHIWQVKKDHCSGKDIPLQ